jgi:hypothetical protein
MSDLFLKGSYSLKPIEHCKTCGQATRNSVRRLRKSGRVDPKVIGWDFERGVSLAFIKRWRRQVAKSLSVENKRRWRGYIARATAGFKKARVV